MTQVTASRPKPSCFRLKGALHDARMHWGVARGDCIKTMARLLRCNKGGWQQKPKQTAQMQSRGHQGPHLSLRCDAGLHQDTSQTAQLQRMGDQDPNQSLGCAVGGASKPKHGCPERSEAKGKLYQDPNLDDGLSGPAPDCSDALGGCMKTQAWLTAVLTGNRLSKQSASQTGQMQTDQYRILAAQMQQWAYGPRCDC